MPRDVPVLEFRVDELGKGRVLLNGQDLSLISDGFTLECRVGVLTTVVIRIPVCAVHGQVACEDVRFLDHA